MAARLKSTAVMWKAGELWAISMASFEVPQPSSKMRKLGWAAAGCARLLPVAVVVVGMVVVVVAAVVVSAAAVADGAAETGAEEEKEGVWPADGDRLGLVVDEDCAAAESGKRGGRKKTAYEGGCGRHERRLRK